MQLFGEGLAGLSHTTAKIIMEGMIESRQAAVTRRVKEQHNADCDIDLIIADNYVTVEHRTFVTNDAPLRPPAQRLWPCCIGASQCAHLCAA
jgi:hypothetical protein